MGWMVEKGTRGLFRRELTMGGLEAAVKLKLCSQPARPGLAQLFANQVTWQVQWVLIFQAPVLGSGSAAMTALLHFVLQGPTCLVLQVSLDFLLLHSSPLS